MKRYDDALASLDYWESLGGGLGDTSYLWLTTMTEDSDKVLAALRRVLLSPEPATYTALDDDLYLQARQVLHVDNRDGDIDKLALEVSQKGNLNELQDLVRHRVASGAISQAIVIRKPELAKSLLEYIAPPNWYYQFLTSREFEPIWKFAENRASPHLGNLVTAYEKITFDKWQENPDDMVAYLEVVFAKAYAQDHEGLIAFVDETTGREDLWETIEEREAWALAEKATALDAHGREDEGNAIFARIAELKAEENTWVVSLLINYATRLADQGRWEEAFVATGPARNEAKAHGTDYARLEVSIVRTCALSKLGRTEEAEAELALTAKLQKNSPSLAAQAYMCAGKNQHAADLLIQSLNNPTTREDTIFDLQPAGVNFVFKKSQLPQIRDLLVDHPKLREAFLKYARFLPEEFYPKSVKQ